MQLSFLHFIQKHDLVDSNQKILIAVSGGVDSIVLTDLFYQNQFKIAVAHCNFQLRGNESDEDEKFVQQFCYTKNIPFFVQHFDTAIYAQQKNISIQMAARDLRYQWFNQLINENNLDKLATAHHKNDSNETVLLNLARGTSIQGLSGILPKRENIIRPLLFATKKQLIDYANQNKLSWREDASNSSNKYKRNFVRNKIIPLFEELNPYFEQRFSENIEKLSEVRKIYNYYIESELKHILLDDKIDLLKIKNSISPISLLWEIIKQWNFSYSDALNILNNKNTNSGKLFLSNSHTLLKDRNFLICKDNLSECSNKPILIEKEGSYTYYENKSIHITFATRFDSNLIKDSNCAFLDQSKIKFPLKLRKWQKGDYFIPFGMKGKQKISDFLTNKKLSVFEKEKVYVLLSEEKIIWVVNHRISNEFKITNNTKNIIQLHIK